MTQIRVLVFGLIFIILQPVLLTAEEQSIMPKNAIVKIIKLEPSGALDPYTPFIVHYEITNQSNSALTIIDSALIKLDFVAANGDHIFSRSLGKLTSIRDMRKQGPRKRRNNPMPWVVKPASTKAAIFPTYNGIPTLPGKQVQLRISVPIADHTFVESALFPVDIIEIKTHHQQSVHYTSSSMIDERSQELLLLDSEAQKRLVLLSSVYSSFLSTVLDVEIPKTLQSPSLLYYWSYLDLPAHVVSFHKDELLVYRPSGDLQNKVARELVVDDRIPAPPGEFIGLIQILNHSTESPRGDYLVVYKQSNQVYVAFWEHIRSKAIQPTLTVVASAEVSDKDILFLQHYEEGFKVRAQNRDVLFLAIEKELRNYRILLGS